MNHEICSTVFAQYCPSTGTQVSFFFPFSGEVLPLQRHECKSNSLNFLLFLPSGISKLFKSKYNPKCCWHTSQVWILFVKTKAREARKHETFVGRQKATSIIKNGWKHYLLFSVSELELMRKIRVRGWGGKTDCTREWGGNLAVVLGDFVAMEISGEAIRNVQIVFE